MFFDDKHVKIHGCTLAYDGITNPDDDGRFVMKVLIPPHCQDLGDMDQLQNQHLAQSKFRGTLPAGGRMAMTQVAATEFNGQFTGWWCMNAKTKYFPDVYDENGALLDRMQLGPLMFQGQQVDVLVHCYDYDNMGQKGIAAGLDAFAIITSAGAQQQQISGGGGINTAGAFGGGQQQAQGGFQQQAPQQANSFMPNGQQ